MYLPLKESPGSTADISLFPRRMGVAVVVSQIRWFVTIDLKDAYFHVCFHTSTTQEVPDDCFQG